MQPNRGPRRAFCARWGWSDVQGRAMVAAYTKTSGVRWHVARRRRVVATAFAVLLSATVTRAESIRVTPITRAGRIVVSFEMRGGFTDEIKAAISSGLTTTFTYDVELRRAASVWLDRTLAVATVSASVRYDNLTRIYQVSRMQDGRVEDTEMIEGIDQVERRLTSFQKMLLFGTTPLEPNVEYYVRVRARTRPRNAMFLLPWGGSAASGTAKFTFIP